MNLFELMFKLGVEDDASAKIESVSKSIVSGLENAAKNGSEAMKTVSASADTMVEAFSESAESHYDDYNEFSDGVKDLSEETAEKVVNDTKSTFDKIEGTSESRISKLAENVGNGLKTAAKIGAAAVAATTAATVGFTKSLISNSGQVAAYGDNIDKMSQKIGISAEAYQEWDFIAQHSGTSMEAIKTSFKTLSTAAQNTSKSQEEALKKIGLSIEDVNKLSTEDLFSTVISRLSDMGESAERTATASVLLGKGALELGALFNTSAQDIEAMREQVHEIGGVMSNEAVKDSAAYQDSLQNLQTTFSGMKNNLISEFLPGMVSVMDGLTATFSGDSEGIGKIIGGIDTIVEKVSSGIPKMIELGSQIIEKMADAIIENLPQIGEAAVDIVTKLSEKIVENLPKIILAAVSIITAIATGIAENINDLIPTLTETIISIAEILTRPETLVPLIGASLEIILAIVRGIAAAIPKLIEAVPTIISNIVSTISEGLPMIGEAGGTILMNLIDGVLAIKDKLGELASELITFLVNGIVSLASKAKESAVKIGNSIYEGIKEKVDGAKKWGSDLINNFVDGLKAKWESLKTTVSNIAGSVKAFLGFSEPEKGPLSDFHTYAPDMMKLFAEGIRDNEHLVTEQLERSFDFSPTIAESSGVQSIGSADSGILRQMLGKMDGMLGMTVTLDSGELVGALTPKLNTSLGNRLVADRRGVIA